jgi:hypothetical protein
MPTVAEDLDQMSKAQLRAEARLRGLSDRGTRQSLLDRLRDEDDEGDEDDHEVDVRDDDEDEDEDDRARAEEDKDFDDDEEDEPRAEDEDDDEDDDEPSPVERGQRQRAGASRFERMLAESRETLQSLVGRPVDAISGIEPTDDGFVVRMEVLEVERVPATTDVLASYELQLDGDGELMSFAKTRRYYRNQQLGD